MIRRDSLIEVNADGTSVRALWNNLRLDVDKDTGLPVTPEGSYWRVSAYSSSSYQYKVRLMRPGFFGGVELGYSLSLDSADILATAVFVMDKYRKTSVETQAPRPTKEQKRANRAQAREKAQREAEAAKARRKEQKQFIGDYPPKRLPKGIA